MNKIQYMYNNVKIYFCVFLYSDTVTCANSEAWNVVNKNPLV